MANTFEMANTSPNTKESTTKLIHYNGDYCSTGNKTIDNRVTDFIYLEVDIVQLVEYHHINPNETKQVKILRPKGFPLASILF